MAEREPVQLEDVFTVEQIQELRQAIKTDNLEAFRTFFESEEFPLLPEDEIDNLPLTFLAIDANYWRGTSYISPNILQYLLDKGARVNYVSLGTSAAVYSSRYWPGDANIDATTFFATLAMNAAISGHLDILKLLVSHGARLDLELHTEGLERIPGEDVLYLTEQALLEKDRHIAESMAFMSAVQQNPRIAPERKQEYAVETTKTLQKETNERLKLARVLKWLRNTTTEENIPAAVSKKQYAAFRNVLRKRTPLGRLEENYMASFLQKPAKFKVQPTEVGLKHINTSVFQGGKTRKRRSKKQRKTRGRK